MLKLRKIYEFCRRFPNFNKNFRLPTKNRKNRQKLVPFIKVFLCLFCLAKFLINFPISMSIKKEIYCLSHKSKFNLIHRAAEKNNRTIGNGWPSKRKWKIHNEKGKQFKLQQPLLPYNIPILINFWNATSFNVKFKKEKIRYTFLWFMIFLSRSNFSWRMAR